MFNCIIRIEVLPHDFVKGVTIPLFKGGKKDPLERDDYRGITIQNVLCKIYDNIIMNRSEKTLKHKVGICNTYNCDNYTHTGIDSIMPGVNMVLLTSPGGGGHSTKICTRWLGSGSSTLTLKGDRILKKHTLKGDSISKKHTLKGDSILKKHTLKGIQKVIPLNGHFCEKGIPLKPLKGTLL